MLKIVPGLAHDEPMNQSSNLLDNNLLVMQQVDAFLANNFDICDTQGNVVGRILGTDSTGARLLLGTREFDLVGTDGTRLAHISDPPDFGFDTFTITGPDGFGLAKVQKRLSFLSRKVSVHLASGEELSLKGEILDYEFTVSLAGPNQPLAQASRKWTGFCDALLDKSRYALEFFPQASFTHRLAILGTMIAVDLMRRKEDKASSS